MRTVSPWFRFVATVTSGALLATPSLTLAQTPPPAPPYPAPAAAPPGQAQPQVQPGDPPALVGRVAALSGTVSFHADDQTEWGPAALNYPVTAGGSFWTEPGARAELEAGVSRLVLDQSTLLAITALDEAAIALSLDQGGLYLWVRDMPQGQVTSVATPRGQITITRPGRYVVLAGTDAEPTRFTVLEGAAQVDGIGDTLQLLPGQTASIAGTAPYRVSVGREPVPPFVTAELARERPPAAAISQAPPPVLEQMTGGDALIGIGSWQASPEYGRIWYPPVAENWAPYRDGHWAWVAPWGWTWVDAAPWGFAPFHYGRWVRVGPRWGWIPEQPGARPAARPVYAPALVAFIGVAAGVAAGAALAGSVGWIPLGPREVYHPPYRHSDRYLRSVNIYNVRNVTNYRTARTTVFVNRGAATMVPRDVMQRSERVAAHQRRMSRQTLDQLRPIAGRPLMPTRATAGMTPDAARRLNLPRPAPGAIIHRPPAPGPAIRPIQRATMPAHPLPSQPGQPRPEPRPTPAVIRPPTPGQPMPQHPAAIAPRPAVAPAPPPHLAPRPAPHPSAPIVTRPPIPTQPMPQHPAAIAPRPAVAPVPPPHLAPRPAPHPSAPIVTRPPIPTRPMPQHPAAVTPRPPPPRPEPMRPAPSPQVHQPPRVTPPPHAAPPREAPHRQQPPPRG